MSAPPPATHDSASTARRPSRTDALWAASRLNPLTTEDGDWLVDPESSQFHDDVRTLVAYAGVVPVDHRYGEPEAEPDDDDL